MPTTATSRLLSVAEMEAVVPLLRAAEAHCVCPVCAYLYDDPIALPCGHVFCRSCLHRCLEVRPMCPLCNRTSSSRRSVISVPNLDLFTRLVRGIMHHALGEGWSNEGSTTSEGRHACLGLDGYASAAAVVDAVMDVTQTARSASVQQTATPANASLPLVSRLEDGPVHTPLGASDSRTQPLHTRRLSTPRLWEGPFATTPFDFHATSAIPSAATETIRFSTSGSRFLGESGSKLGARAGESGELTQRMGSCTPPSTRSPPPPPVPAVNDAVTPVRLWSNEGFPIEPHTHGTGKTKHAAMLQFPLRSAVHLLGGVCRMEPGQCVFRLPSLSVSHGTTRTNASPGDGGRYGGRCALCGLDITDRGCVRDFLTQLLSSPAAHCAAADLAELTEDTLAAWLGPLWMLDLSSRWSARGDQATEKSDKGGGCSPTNYTVTVHAHHNCLAWAGLLPADQRQRHRRRAFTRSLCEERTAVEEDVLLHATEFTVETPLSAGEALERLASVFFPGAVSGTPAGEPRHDPEATPRCAVCRRENSFDIPVKVGTTTPPEAKDVHRGQGSDTHTTVVGVAAVPAHIGLRYCHTSSPPLPPPSNTPATRSDGKRGREECDEREDNEGAEEIESVENKSGIGVSRCAPAPACARQRRGFHLPCALLAGADVCLVLGLDAQDGANEEVEVWCGPCRRRRDKFLR